MGATAGRDDRLVQPPRPEQVDLEGLIDGRVERDVGGAVEDHVEVRRERGEIACHVTLEHGDPLLERFLDGLVSGPFAKCGERRAGDELSDP